MKTIELAALLGLMLNTVAVATNQETRDQPYQSMKGRKSKRGNISISFNFIAFRTETTGMGGNLSVLSSDPSLFDWIGAGATLITGTGIAWWATTGVWRRAAQAVNAGNGAIIDHRDSYQPFVYNGTNPEGVLNGPHWSAHPVTQEMREMMLQHHYDNSSPFNASTLDLGRAYSDNHTAIGFVLARTNEGSSDGKRDLDYDWVWTNIWDNARGYYVHLNTNGNDDESDNWNAAPFINLAGQAINQMGTRGRRAGCGGIWRSDNAAAPITYLIGQQYQSTWDGDYFDCNPGMKMFASSST